jgi:D-alanyl-D-alanine carboxypeptidase/D-alanyl-D-alanine-endopeptidase (penicillin-binding protein 4)
MHVEQDHTVHDGRRDQARDEARRLAAIVDSDAQRGRTVGRVRGRPLAGAVGSAAVAAPGGNTASATEAAKDTTHDQPERTPSGDGTGVRVAWRRRGTRVTALIAGVVALLAVAGGVTAAVLSSRGPAARSNVAPAVRIDAAAPVLGAMGTAATMPTTAGLAAALATVAKDPRLGSHVTISVRDLVSGRVLYGQSASSATTPASTMKLATATALLALRGPDYRITTHVVAGPHPGEVVLVGAGDPTLAAGAKATYPDSGRLDVLADEVKRALGGVKPTKVIIDTSLFAGSPSGPGWKATDNNSSYVHPIYALTTDGGRIDPTKTGNTDRYPNSALAAGQIFARYLGLPATAVANGRAPAAPASANTSGGAAPSAGTPGSTLASVQSAPLAEILDTMLQQSDNVLAEFMARQVAIAAHKPASFAGASSAVTSELAALGLPMAGVHIVDGSGISHLNTLTPDLLTALLSYDAQPDHARFHALFSGLPVAGWSGTLQNRYLSTTASPAAGALRAKTGTLDGVSALAGTVIDSSGRVLSFAVMADKIPDGLDAPAAEDAIGAVLYRCGCGG